MVIGDTTWAVLYLVVSLALFLTGAVVLALGFPSWARYARIGQAAGLAFTTGILVAYVASADTYFNDGTTHWAAHGGAHGFTVAAVCLGVAVAGALLALRRRELASAAFAASILVVVVQLLAVVANSGD
jgi:hypothetical protein